jgi:hypothetical protein
MKYAALLAVWITINGSMCLRQDDGRIRGCWVPDNQALVIPPSDAARQKDRPLSDDQQHPVLPLSTLRVIPAQQR